jgi:hypothetical protein
VRAALRRLRDALRRAIVAVTGRLGIGHVVVLDYPATARTAPAQRPAGPLHDRIRAHEGDYRESLDTLARYTEDLARIPLRAADESSPGWVNDFLPGLDAAAIYGFIRSREPALYMEVGSGNSTKFARRAIADGGLGTSILSIDPHPRAEVDAICDEVIRAPLELASGDLLSRLAAGDVLFFDGSHRAFTGSDVSVFFLDWLPRVPPGVLVCVHDVYLPDDYPADIWSRHYSEQYVLGAMLLADRSGWLRPALAADYASKRPELASRIGSLWDRPELRGAETHGVGFWFEVESPQS